MANGDAAERFLREGLFKYAEARATVVSFEDAIDDEVVSLATAAKARLGAAVGTEIEAHGVCNGDEGGRVAYTHFRGIFGTEPVTWELGVWWQHPSDGDSVAVYAECWKGPSKLTREVWAKAPEDPARVWEAYRGGLNVLLRRDDDLAATFERLVREVAKQASKAGRA
jgi:hypothetical protein